MGIKDFCAHPVSRASQHLYIPFSFHPVDLSYHIAPKGLCRNAPDLNLFRDRWARKEFRIFRFLSHSATKGGWLKRVETTKKKKRSSYLYNTPCDRLRLVFHSDRKEVFVPHQHESPNNKKENKLLNRPKTMSDRLAVE